MESRTPWRERKERGGERKKKKTKGYFDPKFFRNISKG
jgi:hypothetical protein